MYQTLGKIAILLPLLFIVGYSGNVSAADWTETFNSYSNGDLNGQGGWVQTGSNLIQVVDGYLYNNKATTKIATSTYPTVTDSGVYTWRLDDIRFGGPNTGSPTMSFRVMSNADTTNFYCRVNTSHAYDGQYGLSLEVDGDTETSLFVPAFATTTPYDIYFTVNFNDSTCKAQLLQGTYSTTTANVPFLSGVTGPVNHIGLVIDGVSSSAYVYLNGIYLSNYVEGSTTTCSDCTRIISTDPSTGESVPYSTSWDYYVDYYVSSDDYLDGSTKIKLNYQHALYYPHLINGYSIAHEQFTSSVLDSLDNTAIFNFAYAYATGTYNVNIEIYRTIDPPWWNFWSDPTNETLATYNTSFYVDTPTSLTEYQTAQQNAENNMVFINPADFPCDINDIKCMILDFSSTTLHGVPFGYATRIYEILQATTSSSTDIGLAFTFPSTSPASGKSISLSATDAIDEAQSKIGTDFMNKLMSLWNLLWYTLLILWIIKQVFKFRMV